jgi:predicted ribosome quality control (RQC) complex YloA/Tae2 family protein
LDGITLYAIRSEIAGYLPLKVQKIHEPAPKELVISVWNASVRDRLVVSLEANRPFIGFSDERKENPAVPPGFCLGLRKRLEGGKLTSIGQHGLDRVLYLEFLGHDDFGNSAPYVLIVDMAGRGQNIGLYKDGVLEVAAVPPTGDRFVRGSPYKPPPGDRLDLTRVESEDDIIGALEAARSRLSGGRQPGSLELLRSAVEGMGKDLAVSTLVAAGIDAALPVTDESLGDIARALVEVSARLTASAYYPAIYEGARGLPVFHVLPLLQYRVQEEYRSVLDGCRALRRLESRISAGASARAYVESLYKKVEKKLESRYQAQLRDSAQAQDYVKYKVWARLLDSSGVRTPPGHTEVRCTDYYRDPPHDVTVPLDPRYSARDNARNYWNRYAKLSRAQEVLEKSLAKTKAELERLSEAASALRDGGDLEALARAASMIESLARRNAISFRRPPSLASLAAYQAEKPRREGSSAPPSPRGRPEIETVEGRNGAVYLIGGNARENDYLITKLRKPGDIWFHVKNAKGAHVLLRPGETVTDEDILTGARLAAERSEAREASKVEVDSVDASRLRKPRGGPPGFVTYTGQRTVVVSLR